MEDMRACGYCRHKVKKWNGSPCKRCDGLNKWEPIEEESKDRAIKQLEQTAEKAREAEKSRIRPKALPQPVYNYERELSIYPDSIRVSFEDGTTAIYTMHPEQPKPQVIETIRIIRKWNSEGYQCKVQKRRRRCEK